MDDKNNTNKNTVEVVIAGEVVVLSSSESEEYIQKVARYIDKKITDIHAQRKGFSFNSFMKTLLISINIADDLFKEVSKNEAFQRDFQKNNDTLVKAIIDLEKAKGEHTKLQFENATLKKELEDIQNKLITTEKDLEEYISSFDSKATPIYKFKK